MTDRAMSNLVFRLMAFVFWIRDLIRPPESVLNEIEIQPGFHVLDYGCGTGVFSFAVAKLVGEAGKVYAADILPLAVRRVEHIAARKGLSNVEAIRTDCQTGLGDESIDLVLLFDIFHDLSDPEAVLAELHRVLKPGCVLAFSDHHMAEDEILPKMTAHGGFALAGKGKRSYLFRKA